MKKSTLEALYNLVNGRGTVTEELRNEVTAEYERTTEKTRANKTLYQAAHDALMASPNWNAAMTSGDLWAAVAAEMPDGFTEAKMRYGIRNYWLDEVEINDEEKPATYQRKVA